MKEKKSFRLFLPIYKCNPPYNYFILDDKILHFEHNRLYYLNTCKEHIVFTSAQMIKDTQCIIFKTKSQQTWYYIIWKVVNDN